MRNLFNVWLPGQHSKTGIIAGTESEAQDRFCQRHGYVDRFDFCAKTKRDLKSINTQQVGRVTILKGETA